MRDLLRQDAGLPPSSQQRYAAYTICLLQRCSTALEDLSQYWLTKQHEIARQVYIEQVANKRYVTSQYSKQSASTLEAITGGWTPKAKPRPQRYYSKEDRRLKVAFYEAMLYKNDYIFQRRWDCIEWVVPSNRQMPLPDCSRLDKVTDVDHWVGHNSAEWMSEVIDPQFFEENKDVFPAKMLEYFKKKANHSHRLRDSTMKKLCRAADAAVPQGHVQRIERKEEMDRNGATTYKYYGRISG